MIVQRLFPFKRMVFRLEKQVSTMFYRSKVVKTALCRAHRPRLPWSNGIVGLNKPIGCGGSKNEQETERGT